MVAIRIIGAVAGVVIGLFTLISVWAFIERDRRTHGIRKRELPKIGKTHENLKAVRAEAGGFTGVEAVFGCGHRQHIQLLHRSGGHIIRNVPYRDARHRNCHACWLRTGTDRRSGHEDDPGRETPS